MLRNFGLLRSEKEDGASLTLIPLSFDVPYLSPEKRVRARAFLCPPDYLRTPPTIQEDLANGRPNLDCHSSFHFDLVFFAPNFLVRVRHFAPCLDLLMTGPAMTMLKTNMYQYCRILMERQEGLLVENLSPVQCSESCVGGDSGGGAEQKEDVGCRTPRSALDCDQEKYF